MAIKIQEIVLDEKMLQATDIGVAVLQIRSPFYNDLRVVRGDSQPILAWDEEAFRIRYAKIRKALDNISKLNRRIDFLILPEYSVHVSMIDMFQAFSESNNCICIVNYYDPRKRANISRVVLPEKHRKGEDVFEQYKILPADGDIDLLNKEEDLFSGKGSHFYRFVWNKLVDGKKIKHYFQIFNCIDYLNFANDYIDFDNPGLIFVPACSNNVESFYSIGDVLLRKSLSGVARKSIVSVFCNNSHLLNSDDVGKGGSCIIASKGKHVSTIMGANKECILIADINCLTHKVQPSGIGIANTSINSVITKEISENGELLKYEPLKKFSPVINPNIFSELKLSRYYFLYRSKNYYKIKNILSELTVGSAGIFGFHDILIKARDESSDYVRLRISQTMKKNKSGFKVDGPEILKVVKQLKFRGLPQSELKLAKGVDHIYLRREIDTIKCFFFGGNINEEKYSDYLKKRIFLTDIQPGDLTDDDRDKGYSEFHLYVFLENNRYESSEDVKNVFENNALNYLYTNTKVKTIESIEAEKTERRSQIQDADYILHIVGTVDDVTEAVLKLSEIFDTIDGYSCSTRVIPIAEMISSDKFECLSETITNTIPLDADVIWKIISKNINNQKPFLIKSLSVEQMHDIAELYHLCRSWSVVLDEKLYDSAYSEFLMKSFYDFVYGVALFIVGEECSPNTTQNSAVSESEKEKLYFYTQQLVKGVAVYYERVLKKLISESCEKYGGAQGMISSVVEANKDNSKKLRPKIENSDTKKCSMGDLINIIVFYNNYITPKIYSESFIKKVNGTQGFSHYRNCYSHAADIEDQGDSKGIGRVLDCISDRNEPMKIVKSMQNVLTVLIEIYDEQ